MDSAREHATERHGTWHSYDAPYQRLRLFSPWTVAGFGLALTLGLVLVFPHDTLEQRLSHSGDRADRLTVEYLKVFIKAEPNAHELRLALAKKLVQLGAFGEARAALAALPDSVPDKWQAEAGLLEMEMLSQEAFAIPEGEPERAERIARVHQQMRLLVAQPLTVEQLLLLGRQALALGENGVAADAFKKVMATPGDLPGEFYAEAARTMLGLGQYRVSAELSFRAMQRSTSLRDKREFFIQGLRALQAASLFDDALRMADRHIGPLADDYQTLMFLTRLAQAANRPEKAESYAKRMLRLSHNAGDARFAFVNPQTYQSPLDFYLAAAKSADAPKLRRAANGYTPPAGGPALPFDEEAYTLAYNVFLANRNLADALRLAQAAVRQRPDSAIWRRRLAEVSEWSGQPQEALAHWLAYARLGGDPAAWDAVLRLGESLYDRDALMTALRHKLAADPRQPKWLERIVQIYEFAGEPERAIALLEERLQHNRRGRLPMDAAQRRRESELLADVALRAGQDDKALQSYRNLQSEYGPSGTYALQIANILYRRGQISAAFAALEQGMAAAATDQVDFWRAYAELARLLQNDDAAQAGYRKLLAGDNQSEADLINLTALLDAQQPRAAAMVAEFAFEKTGNPRFAVQALNYRARVADWQGALRFLRSLPQDRLAVLEQSADFLAARAVVRQSTQDLPGAVRDIRAALAIRPADSERRAALIWLLIASRDAQALDHVLRKWAADAKTDGALWGPFAAANMALNRQDVALYWFRRGGILRDDYLWMMSYAEALDATSQPELAWRIRRKVWQDLRKSEVLRRLDPEQLGALRDRLASVAPLFAGGDAANSVIQALLRADVRALVREQPAPAARSGMELIERLSEVRDDAGPGQARVAQAADLFAPGSGKRPRDDMRLSATARELALAYALNREAHDLARAWLVSRFAGQLAKPLWGELALLLATEDRDRLNRLLDDLPDWLPMYDRIEAAQRAGRPALAQTLAFDQLARLPHDEQLHLRLTNLLTGEPARLQADATAIKDAALKTARSRIETTVNLSSGLRLSLTLNQDRHRNTDAAQLGFVSARDDELAISLRRVTDTGFVTLAVTHRQAARDIGGLRLEYSLSPASGLAISARLNWRQMASESALLRAGGMRSGVEGNMLYAFSKREYASLGISWHRYFSQQGTLLGSGHGIQAEAGTHFRIEYPNLTLRAFVSRAGFDANGRFDSQIAQLVPAGSDPAGFRYLPTDSTLYGISLGLGTVVENNYTRALRPFFELGLAYSEQEGSSYNYRGGLAGSVLGHDMLMLRLGRSSARPERPQGVQEFGLHYRWYY